MSIVGEVCDTRGSPQIGKIHSILSLFIMHVIALLSKQCLFFLPAHVSQQILAFRCSELSFIFLIITRIDPLAADNFINMLFGP